MSQLEGRVMIITGASSGIGAATAELLAPLGVKLMLAARREDRLRALQAKIERAGGVARGCVTDVASRASAERMAAETVSAFGRIDAVFNNAGVMPLSLIEKLQVDEWDRMIDINIKGVLYCVAAVLPQMKKQGSGHIINNCSIAGHRVIKGGAVYSATKFAVRALSEGLRAELTPQIRVTNISPGAVVSELRDHITDAHMKEIMTAPGRPILPTDAIARAVKYALEQPADVDVNEVLVRPAGQVL